jgi:micrococcal nuclease
LKLVAKQLACYKLKKNGTTISIMKNLLCILLTIVVAFTTNPSIAQSPLQGKVIKIIDGDTYDLLVDRHTTKRIRMEGIDAPERGMPFYKLSKIYLGQLCLGKQVSIEPAGLDRYGRTLAKTRLANGKEAGLLMVEAGYAWQFKKYSTDKQLAKAEMNARNNRLGLWKEKSAEAPWVWRKNKINNNRAKMKMSHFHPAYKSRLAFEFSVQGIQLSA